MAILDLLLRGAALGGIGFVCIGLLAGASHRRKAASVACFGVLIACYLLVSSPNTSVLLGAALPVFVAGAVLAPVGFTWTVLEIFHDRIGDKWAWLAVAGLTMPAAMLIRVWEGFDLLRGIIVIGLYLGLLVMALATGSDDLVEKRRLFRRWFVGIMVLLGLAISVAEISIDDARLPAFIYPLQAAAFLLVTGLFGIWAFHPAPGIWPAAATGPDRETHPMPGRDSHLTGRLNALIGEEIWRQEGLTIGSLAARLDVPEHRLRTVINRDMGFRNFSTYINGYRIRAAMAALDDPARTGTTILQIAYECGFASLGPFNRAFRRHTGRAPSDFRARAR